MTYYFGVVKSVGENEIILSLKDEDYVIILTDNEAKGLHHALMNNDEILVPFYPDEKRLALDQDGWSESRLSELNDV